MRYGTDTHPDPGSPFDTDNHAWQRFTAVAADHFDVVTWTRPDDRPVLVSLVDLPTGDTFTVAVLGSVEVRDPHALLVLSTSGHLTVHGPADGIAAADHAPHLALTDTTVQATRPVPLHHPATPALPETAWVDLPAVPVTAAPVDDDGGTRTVALLLIDDEGDRLAVVGPFPDRAAADRWQPTDGRTVQRHVTLLQPIPPAPPSLP
ncbi:hypothetical protein AB0H83_35065 [Dactylosporangium sp. NPDC050688]|uniref:hypothetical protein n=1 Tax=Dactylosporangium sp. NPDC050688 TaxID=3157217 RepID=UPI003406A114